MTWVKIDDNLPQNLKVRSVSAPARWAYVSSICYAGANRTDGIIPRTALAMLDATPKIAAELLAARLWKDHVAGWEIHDFLKHNRAREASDALSEKRREAGRKGIANRWQTASNLPSKTDSKPDSNLMANGLSGSGSLDPDPLRQVAGFKDLQEQQERQNDSNLPDTVYRQIDTAWIQSAGTTLPRVAGERFESYALKVPLDWVLAAISETGHANKKDPRYTYAILDNWIRDGREQGPADAPNPFKASQVRIDASRAAAAARGVL